MADLKKQGSMSEDEVDDSEEDEDDDVSDGHDPYGVNASDVVNSAKKQREVGDFSNLDAKMLRKLCRFGDVKHMPRTETGPTKFVNVVDDDVFSAA